MQQFSGKSVCKGMAYGPVTVLRSQKQHIRHDKIWDVKAELERVNSAVECARKELQSLYERASQEIGISGGEIFQVHRMILEDEEYLKAVRHTIQTEMVNAEYAVEFTSERYGDMFFRMKDDYMRARAMDIKDVSDRLLRVLNGREDTRRSLDEPAIIVADDLSPSETMGFCREKVLAFVTVRGSTNSHTAILARLMNIPALVGVPVDLGEIQDGIRAFVDGFEGMVTFEPDEDVYRKANERMEDEQEKLCLFQKLKGKESITPGGKRILICANIGSVRDVERALENDAEGIGLFRSEFLYLGRKDFPTEEEQFQAYRQAAQQMAGKEVIIRTLDMGADKQAEYFGLGREENPAMGFRAIRICLKQPEILKTQLRALLRAAVYGNISVIYPMIISVEEVKRIFEIAQEVREELESKRIPYRYPRQGVMIETPAAVMVSDELARLVDFFSIGTNDLTQYTLAVDKKNEKLCDFYDPHHKAIMRMIRIVTEHAHKYGKKVGICGELGADTSLTEEFVRMGIDELSVVPSMVLKLRKIVRELKDD